MKPTVSHDIASPTLSAIFWKALVPRVQFLDLTFPALKDKKETTTTFPQILGLKRYLSQTGLLVVFTLSFGLDSSPKQRFCICLEKSRGGCHLTFRDSGKQLLSSFFSTRSSSLLTNTSILREGWACRCCRNEDKDQWCLG